jgi:hypothetical protein
LLQAMWICPNHFHQRKKSLPGEIQADANAELPEHKMDIYQNFQQHHVQVAPHSAMNA